MLEWMHPVWFVALPLAVLPVAAWMRPHAMQFGAVGAIRARRGVRVTATALPPLLEALAFVCVIAALARPQEIRRETIRETPGIDILLAIDTSGSMEAPDMGSNGFDLTRLEAAKRVMATFVEGRPDDRVGLLVFGEEAFVQVPLTLDHVALNDFIGQLEIGMAGKNATAVGSAVAVGAKRMKEIEAPSRILVLVTDGRSNAGPLGPLQAAEAAAALGIRVYTIGVGATNAGGGGLLGLLRGSGADVDEPTLRAVATRTGGKYYRATDAAALGEVYADIDRLEKTTARTREFVHRDELFLMPLLPGLALLLAHTALTSTVLRRLP
jgi:Ca-activated chloride channel family protein